MGPAKAVRIRMTAATLPHPRSSPAATPALSRFSLTAPPWAFFRPFPRPPPPFPRPPPLTCLGPAADIKQAHPIFPQRLIPAVSQLLERPEYRASPQILDHLIEEVAAAM